MADQTPEPMSMTDRDLALVAEHGRPDEYLQQIVGTAEDGLGVAVGLLVNGMIVYGALAPENRMPEEIDAYWEWIATAFEERGVDPERWAENREALRGKSAEAAAEGAREREEHYRRVQEEYGDSDPLPAELARESMRHAFYSAVTVTDATIVGASGQVRVGVLRVQLRQVSGWWLVRDQDQGVGVVLRDAPPDV